MHVLTLHQFAGTDTTSNALSRILQMLSLHCKTWDLEILDAICQLFPQLRRLKLTFDIREPGKLWEHNDYWNGVQPYEMYEALEEARSRPEFASGSRGPDEVRRPTATRRSPFADPRCRTRS